MKNVSSKVNNEQYFSTDHLKADLKGRSVRGGAVTMAAQITKFVLQMGSTVVLARLLVPEDYGLIGMVTVVIGFAELFKDLGLSTATIQKAEINHKQVSTLFWINFAISCVTGLVVAGLAPVIAWFYKEPRLTWITLALASSFILGGLTVQHQALLKRQMSFTSLAKIEITSMLAGVVTAMISAWYGLGYWALVFMQIATAIANAIGVWVACSWRPGVPLRRSGIRSMLAFGGNMTGFNIVNYFSRNLDNILIGQYWGPQQLGLYAQAYKLLLLPINQINAPISTVALPALSSLQSEPEKYRRYYYKAILLITTIGMPIVAFMFASADKVILLTLGKQWLEAVPIFRSLMPAAFIGTFNVADGWVYQSLGRTDRQFLWGIVSSIINVIVFIISIRWGAIGVARGYSLYLILQFLPRFFYCYRGTQLRNIDLISTLLRPVLASLGAAAVIIIITNQLISINTNLIIGLFIDWLLYCLAYFGIWIVLPNGKTTLLEMFQFTKVFKRKTREN
ncbi:lipopolysaccharide biosynthesis protein [Plectonema cf. radiosum LEGE 06105]|uniref:Lipopolysaccharide biosynthesis protein n=1 Tax=Plectonema cf. radiosum LEGE 06105 TaxID=945769 RepID=A0A8J7EZK8_9CYAN|nr:lipopolysaccharide biosynthesis protein [Plectonema radiosum]MBE9213111.1 lipopolysaccharide biosynthesis protein [Plectonema cf. radiosum LEGE 06105]